MKYRWIKQQSGEDCGAASLAIVAQHYDFPIKINRLRELVGTGRDGTTLLGLKQGAETLGFRTHAIQGDASLLDDLSELPMPAILYWDGYHFTVLHGQETGPTNTGKYVIADPAIGLRYLTKAEMLKHWQGGVILLLEPDPEQFGKRTDLIEKSSVLSSVMRRLVPQRSLLLRLVVLNLFLAALSLAAPLLMQVLTDRILIKQDAQLLVITAIGVIGLYTVNSFFSLIQSQLVARFSQRLQSSLKSNFGEQILRLPLIYHEGRRSGTIMSRLGDIQLINYFLSQIVITIPSQLFIALISITVITLYSWKLAAISCVMGGIMVAITIELQPRLQQATFRSFETTGKTYSTLAQSFNGALTVKSITAAPQLWQEIQGLLHQETTFNLRATQIGITNEVLVNFVFSITTIFLLWAGSLMVFAQELSIGQLIAAKAMNDNFLMLVTTLTGFATQFTRVKTVTQLLDELFDFSPEDQGDQHKPTATISSQSDILCQDIHYHYAGRPKLFDNFSATIPGGKVTALVGRSGCGKSTLAKILAGLYPVATGSITVDDANLLNLPLENLRQQVVLVTQETFFFTRSIADNFRLANPNASFEEIVAVCKIAGADEFIQTFPERYETVLGAVAANLSGGQKQRLGIARGLITDPAILILDESTANLDPVTEGEVLDRVLTHRKGRTTILISHRPRVISSADWIVLLDQGAVEIEGATRTLQQLPGNHLDFLAA